MPNFVWVILAAICFKLGIPFFGYCIILLIGVEIMLWLME